MATFQREAEWSRLQARPFDLVVIGAGMTGAGIALDASLRGLRVLVVDAGDFASGTSSKSSKLVHGGLRYLEQREFRLVYENLRERQRLLANAPYLVSPLAFLIPLFGNEGAVSRTIARGYSTTLSVYDLTGGWRIGRRHRRISKDEARAYLPTLRTERLVAGFLYYDARADDARVGLTLIRSAHDLGAVTLNYARVDGLTRNELGRVSAVHILDVLSGREYTVAATCVVNATGVWAGDIDNLSPTATSPQITPAKGVHITVRRHRLPAEVAALVRVAHDRRGIFIIPFEDAPFTYIGTTDTPYEGPLNEPMASPDDVAYLLDAVNGATSSSLTSEDVTGVWAGLRPLLTPPSRDETIKVRTADLSRRHRVLDAHDGLIHVTGGKWTTYRQMAEDTVDALAPYLPRMGRSRTKNFPLHGVSSWRPESELENYLFRRYGGDTPQVLQLIGEEPALGDCVIEGLPYLGAEFVYAARYEMATDLIDILTRRTRAHLYDARHSASAAPAIARLVAPTLGWGEDDQLLHATRYQDLVDHELSAAGLQVRP